MPKILSIVETAYRATLEEQDDTIVWINAIFKSGGADVSLLLRGNAVNYAVKGQDAAGLQFGSVRQEHPPRVDKDLAKLIDQGVPVFAVEEDLKERGIADARLLEGARKVSRRDLARIFDEYDHVWHW